MALQNVDGSWGPSSALQHTAPNVKRELRKTPNAGPVFDDKKKVFTTATVLRALVDYRASLAEARES